MENLARQGKVQCLGLVGALSQVAQGVADKGRQRLGQVRRVAGEHARRLGAGRRQRRQLGEQAQQVGLQVLAEMIGGALHQARLEEQAALLQGLAEQLGIAHLLRLRQAGEEALHGLAQAVRQVVAAVQPLQGGEQAFQGSLAGALPGQLLAQRKLVEASAERQEVDLLAVFHQRREQAADRQRLGRVEAQLAAGERRVEQVQQDPVDHLLGLVRRQRGAGQDLALEQGAGRQLLQVEAAQRASAGHAVEQGCNHAGVAGGADVEQVARHQRPIALHFHQALPAVRQGQLEQDLEIVRQAFLDRQHLGLAADQEHRRSLAIAPAAAGVGRRPGVVAGKRLSRLAWVTTCLKRPCGGWGRACIMPRLSNRLAASSPV